MLLWTDRLKLLSDPFRDCALITLSLRNGGTPYEVKNVPPSSRENPEYLPTRGKIFRRTTVYALICYLFIDFSSLSVQPEQNLILYSSGHVHFFTHLQDISREEFVVKTLTSIVEWVGMYCHLKLYLRCRRFLCVVSELDDVRYWRPAFGPLEEAYSIRQLWRYAKRLFPLYKYSEEWSD